MDDADCVTNRAVTMVPDGRDGSEFAFEHIERKQQMSPSDVRMVEVLDFASTPVAESELIEFMQQEFGFSQDSASETLDHLRSYDIIVDPDDVADVHDHRETWEQYNWGEAFEYYLYFRNYPFLDYAEGKEAFEQDHNLMMEYREEEPIPPNYKEYEDADTVDLPDVEGEVEFPSVDDVLSAPITGVGDGDESVDRETLAAVLFYVFGEIGRVEFPNQGECLRKTSPSGGARHPTEAYVATLDVENVPEGLYHYSVKDHALDVLRTGDLSGDLTEIVYELRERPSYDVSFVVFFTSVVERSMWRYREPRTYTVVQNDVGHLMETLRVVGNANGLQTMFGHGYEDDDLSDLLELDCFDEPIFRYAALGN